MPFGWPYYITADIHWPYYITADIHADKAQLVDPLIYHGKTDTFTVPAGFATDFASVPQFVTWLVPKMGTYTQATILHDYLCTQLEARHQGQRELSGDDVFVPASARDTDAIFRRVMREEGVPLVRRWLMWTAVRWGALINPARRAGWSYDAARVLAISLLAAPIVAPAALLAGLTLLVDRVVEGIR